MNGILLIAENAQLIQSLTDMLTPDYRVRCVRSEREGLEALAQESDGFAAVLIELKLSRESGFAFSDGVQERASFLSMPMLAITDERPSEANLDWMDHGFFDAVTADVPRPLLHQRIRNAIQAKDSLSLAEVEKMLKNFPACIFLKDREGKYVFSTQTWRHLNTGGDPNWTIRGKTDLDIRRDKENAKKAMEADRRIIETGVGTEYVIEENQDGIRDYLQIIKRPVYDKNGKVNGIIALINNITDHQLLKLELERRVKTDSDMITAMAADYQSIFYANLDSDTCMCVRATKQRQAGTLWEGGEFSFREGFAEYARRYVAPADRDAFLNFVDPQNIRAGLADRAMISLRYLKRTDDVEEYEMLRMAGVRMIADRDDHIVHAIAAGFSDVDRETREQMEQNRALTEALARAEEANAAKTSFLNSISHEMRTPLNVIIGLDNLALSAPSVVLELRDNLEKIGSSARHLLSLIDDILDMSRIESGHMELKEEEFSFRTLLEQIIEIFMGQCRDAGLEFVCPSGELPEERFLGDGLRLKQVLFNILSNAVKYTDAPGTVSLSVERREAGAEGVLLCFTVTDTGIGMDSAFLPRLFEPFSREDNTITNRYSGSGLGMAITKNIVDLMGGSICVESAKGRGTTVSVRIPLRRAQSAQAVIELDEEEVLELLSGRHVLIAEDMEMNAEILADLLDMDEITSEWAEDGQKAVELFQKNQAGHFDAILMDMRMPVMDGLTAARTIRGLDRPDARTIPIIAVTANALEEDANACLQAGMNAHLAKPVDIERLESLLVQLLPKR